MTAKEKIAKRLDDGIKELKASLPQEVSLIGIGAVSFSVPVQEKGDCLEEIRQYRKGLNTSWEAADRAVQNFLEVRQISTLFSFI